ncbi:HD domain-containing protein [Dyella solisilvae]|uniref:HD domain-containing protein n=1 Tax=Dyella solisilvae TaxID=1920168 RepID=A0A370K4G6_9GAMM|nr:HD domain-containing phosphohydrolase [Dyella solisilvae]RDI97539.1 HD domain-containing protein [Dyella solisilvae]
MTLKPQIRIVAIYLTASWLWVFCSDRLLFSLGYDKHTLSMLHSLKGGFFVLCSGLLLYWMIGRVFRRMDRLNHALLEGNEQSLTALVSAMDARHKETRDHSERVMRMTVALAQRVGLDGDALRHVRFGALLHDIGKLALPDAILIKPGPLTEDETTQMRTHPSLGKDLLMRTTFLRPAIDIPYAHHERWDGTGYPRGLSGDSIPLAARIFSVVDVWDALSFPRVYKHAWPEHDVLDYLRNAAGGQLDPQIVALFLEHYDELKAVGMDAAVAD